MKTIGLIGGMSWESSSAYYRIINETVKTRLGGFHSAKSLMYSVDFAEIEAFQQQSQWNEAAQLLVTAAKNLQNGGADFIVLCTNTMHKVADQLQASVSLPFLHIADATAQRIKEASISKVGLLGTRFTMDQDFYKGRLSQQHGLTVSLPDAPDREIVHRIIYDELVLGEIRQQSKEQYVRIIEQMTGAGAEAIILGCTEIGLLIQQQDCPLPLFDTARIHAEAAVEFALSL